MTDRNLQELAAASIVEGMGGPNAWLVDFGDGDYDIVNKTAKNRLVLEDGVLTAGENTFFIGGIRADVDTESDAIMLADGTDEVRVPTEKHEHVLWSIHDSDGDRLQRLFDELNVPTVRKGLMDMLMPRFRGDHQDIRKREDGWVVGGDILVEWDASNHPLDVDQIHVREGNDTVPVEDREARSIDFRLSDDTRVTLPNGTETDLREVEMEFLVTVGLVTGRNPRVYDDGLATSIEQSRINGFTDTRSGLYHGHGMGKHTLDMLGVTDEASEKLYFNSYDHAGVWEMAERRREFENAPIDVFTDASNDDESKWNKIESTKRKAPIPKSVKNSLKNMYN